MVFLAPRGCKVNDAVRLLHKFLWKAISVEVGSLYHSVQLTIEVACVDSLGVHLFREVCVREIVVVYYLTFVVLSSYYDHFSSIKLA